MSEQLALSIAAAGIGFIAGIFFCIGNALNGPKEIAAQVTLRRTGYIEPLARSLAAQRAQYIVGALFLIAAFVLQLAAALASATEPATLPPLLRSWPALLLAVCIAASLLGWVSVRSLCSHTVRNVLLHVPSSNSQSHG
jgi:hypothetical protein